MWKQYNVDVVDLKANTAESTISILGTIRGKDIPDGFETVEITVNSAQARWIRRNLKKAVSILEDSGT